MAEDSGITQKAKSEKVKSYRSYRLYACQTKPIWYFGKLQQRLIAALSEHMKATGDPRASGDGGIFKHYPVWRSGGGRKMGGYNRAGVLETFPEAEYAEWIKKNFPRK